MEKEVKKQKFKQWMEYEKELRKFSFQTPTNTPKITNFTPQACFYRWLQRPQVDDLFSRSYAVFKENKDLAYSINQKARKLWHQIIMDSNQL